MIISRPYQYLVDHTAIYHFMIDIYERDWKNGVPAPFLEYALCSTWMDKRYLHRNRVWLDNDKIVAFVFTESDPAQIFFSLRPGYEYLAGEMIQHAERNMLHKNGKQKLVLFKGQNVFIDIVRMSKRI